MKDFFIDLFAYHRSMNHSIFEILTNHSDKIPDKSIFLLSHSINAHQIWTAKILDIIPIGLNDIHSLDKCKSINNENFSNTDYIINECNFIDTIMHQNREGEWFENTIQEILFHIANHFTHHRAQIIADLRQNNIQPFITDYIYFKMKNNESK